MTPEQLTGLIVLLLDLYDWLEETDPGTLDVSIVERAVTICAERRAQLVGGGAR